MKISSVKQLRELYSQPSDRAKKKVLNALEKHAIHFITTSPFLTIATFDKDHTIDTSPRGGAPGFVKIIDQQTIAIPDFSGNNRLDSLTNIIETGRFASLFFIPGIDETLRLNGTAYISTNSEHLQLFTEERKVPKSCIVVQIEEVFLHCAKAFMRSNFWDKKAQIESNSFPSMGRMLKDQLGGNEAAESREHMIRRYQKDL
jgi:hypothetical protein